MGNLIVQGAGGGKEKGGGGTEMKDNLQSKQIATVVDVLCEGPIVGLVNGLRSIYLNETVLMNDDGTGLVSDNQYGVSNQHANFVDVSAQWRNGTQDQPPIDGIADVEFEALVNLEVKSGIPVIQSLNNPVCNSVRITVSTPALTDHDKETGNLRGSSVSFKIEVRAFGGSWVEKIVNTIKGKTTSRYQRTFLIALDQAGPWDIRITRTTTESASITVQHKLFFDSMTGIIESKLNYPNTALVAMRIDSSQFNTIPSRAFGIKGLIISVPTNYNPETRVYTGVWDGTFKQAWTDNPAWCFYDLLTARRYGLGDIIPASSVDKWSLYSIAQYCDQMVQTGYKDNLGNPILEPRFTCNLFLQSDEEAYVVIQNFASIFRAITFWAGGSIVAMQDRPADAVALFTNANAIDGVFTYSGISLKQRRTVALVAWNDPKDFYRQKVEYVQDDEGVKKYGVIQSEVTAFGCASKAQANRMGKWMLATEKLATETVTFKAGMEGATLYPGAIINTSDVLRAGTRMGGRIASATLNTVTLDADAVIEAGKTYTVSLVQPSGALVTRDVTNTVGTLRTLNLGTALPAAPLENSVFIFAASDLKPEFWRVLGVKEEEEGSQVEITAVAHIPELFANIEQGISFTPAKTSSIKARPGAPTGLNVRVSRYQLNGEMVGMRATLSWNGAASEYRVSFRRANGVWERRTVGESSLDIDNVESDFYEFEVIGVSSIGRESPVAALSQVLTPEETFLPVVGGLALESAFTSSEAKFKWNSVPGATTYEVKMVRADNNVVVRTVNVGNSQRYEYAADDMKADGGPWRSMKISVRAIGAFGSFSGAVSEITISNPQVGAIAGITVDPGIQSATLSYTKPADSDFAGVRVYIGTTPGFVADATSLVYEGSDSSISLNKQANGSPFAGDVAYYLKMAGFDAFGKDSLAISAPVSFTPRVNVAGVNGLNSATLRIYQRSGSATPPAKPSAVATYTYASGVLTGLNNGWLTFIPSAGGQYLHTSVATAIADTPTDTIAVADWADVQLMYDATDLIAARTAADAARVQADAANLVLDKIFTNGVLSRDEKPDLIRRWAEIGVEDDLFYAQAASLGVATTGYTAAINALAAYLTSLVPAWNDLTQHTDITRGVADAKWNDYYSAKVSLLNSIAAKAATTANWANGLAGRPLDAELLNSAIVVGGQNLVPDSSFERGTRTFSEKTASVTAAAASNIVGFAAGTQALFIESGAPGIGKDSYVYVDGTIPVVAGRQYVVAFMYNSATNGAITGSSNYLRLSDGSHVGLVIPVLNTGGAWTRFEMLWTCPAAITSVQFRFGIGCTDYSWIAADCMQLVEGNKAARWSPSPVDAQAASDAANAAINAIFADGVLDRSEKTELIRRMAEKFGEYDGFLNQAASLSVSSADYVAKNAALNSYLAALSPAWNDLTQNTNIVRVDANAAWNGYYTAKAALQNAMAAKAATLATWAGTTGPGRPSDNATADITFIGSAGMLIEGNAMRRTGADTGAWDQQVYTPHGFVGGAFASVIATATTNVIFGLNTDPTTDASWTSIDFAVHLNSSGGLDCYESSNSRGSLGSYLAGDMVAVKNDGSKVTYEKNGVVLRTVVVSITLPLFFDSSFYGVFAGVRGVRFLPLSNLGDAAADATAKANAAALVAGTAGKGAALNSDPACINPAAWDSANTVVFGTVTDGPAGNNVIRSVAAAFTSFPVSKRFPMTGGRKYKLSAWFRSTGGASKTAYFRVKRYNGSGALITEQSGYENTPVPNAWTLWSTTLTAETGTASGAITTAMNWNSVGDGSLIEMQDARVEDVTDVVAAQSTATTASQTAATAQNTANAAQSTANAAIPGGSYSLTPNIEVFVSGANGDTLTASLSVAVSGGVTPYKYTWSFSKTSFTSSTLTSGTLTAATCNITCSPTNNTTVTGNASVTVIDARGISISSSGNQTFQFGTPL